MWLCQVAKVQDAFPGMVAAFFMSYLQEDDSPQPAPDATVRLRPADVSRKKLDMPSTASGAVLKENAQQPGGLPDVQVPKITFLYRCAGHARQLSNTADIVLALPMHRNAA